MRQLFFFSFLVLLSAAANLHAQSSRYDVPQSGGGPAPTPTELPFGNSDLSSQFDATDLSSSQPPQPTEQTPATQRRQTPAAAPAAPTARPARTYGGAASSVQSGSDTRYAESLMRDALTPPPGTQLSGSKIYLADVVRAAGNRRQQSQGITAYWDLCSATADYYLSLYEQAELQRLARRLGQSQPLQNALAIKQTRRDTALTAARASQLRLAALVGRSQAAPLPLPGDMPLTAVYHTRHSQNFASGGPREASELNRLLPLRHRELLGAATAVGEAEDFFGEVVRRAETDRQDQGKAVVKALELLALNRRAFVQISRDYNKRITRYTELARPGQLRTERLVAMLIKSPNLASRTSQPTMPGSRRSSQTTPPATFQEDLANPMEAAAPRLDSEVLPVGAMENHSMVEKIAPGESSVLLRDGEE